MDCWIRLKVADRLSFLTILLLALNARASVWQGHLIASELASNTALDRSSPKKPQGQTLDPWTKFSGWVQAYLATGPEARGSMLAEGESLASNRRIALNELIKADPKRALALAINRQTRQQLPLSVSRYLENAVDGIGSLNLFVADDFEHGTSIISRRAVIAGKTYQAYVSGWRLRRTSQKNARMHGVAIGNLLAVSEDPARPFERGEVVPTQIGPEVCAVCGQNAARLGTKLYADLGDRVVSLCGPSDLRKLNARLTGDSGGITGTSDGIAPQSWTRGTKRLLFMRVAFTDDPAEPITGDAANVMMDQVNQWYIENSYDSTAIISDVTPLLIMPQTKSAYSLLGTTGLQTDARRAALSAGFDSDTYDLDIVLFNPVNGPDFAGWNGLANIGAKGVWMQGTMSAGVAAHELGHNYGLYHANSWTATGDSIIGPGSTLEYGNPFDTMASNPQAGIYQFNAQYKNQLNWLPDYYVQSVNNSGIYRLYAFDVPQMVGGRNYALRVRKDSARDYWAELRQQFTSNPWLQNGILLNWAPWNNGVANSLGGTTLLDTTPGTPTANNGKDDAAVVLGRTFADAGAGVYITPLAKGSDGSNNWIDVQINLGSFTNNVAPTLQISADQTNVALNTPVSFVAAASDENADSLAYYWDFGDLTFGSNSPSAIKSWSIAGQYTVRCTVSDMKGGFASRYAVITVGTPGTLEAAGRITSDGQPMEGVRVSNGLNGSSYCGTYTDSDGYYTLANLTAGTSTLSAVKYGYNLDPFGWGNPVSLSTDLNGLDWNANPNPVIAISVPDPFAARPNPTPDTATLTLFRSGSLTAPSTVRFNLNGTASYGGDYVLNPTPSGSAPPYQVTLPAGVYMTNLVVVPLGNSAADGNETALMTLIEDPTYIFGTFAEAAVTISDNTPPLPIINLYADKDSAPQSGSDFAWLRFTRDTIGTNDLTVFYTIGGTATNGVDYQTLSGSMTIPAGKTEMLAPVAALNKDDSSGNKTVSISLASNPNYYVGSSSNATVTIFDDYFTTVTISATDSVATEGASDIGVFTVTRVGSLSANLVVNYGLGGTAINGVDYATLAGAVIIPAGMSTASITVSPANNSSLNGKRSVIATVLANSGYNVGRPGTATIELLDDELPSVSLVASVPDASEAGPVTGQFTFSRTGNTSSPLTAYFDIYGTGRNGADYVAITNSITIPPGASSAVLNITPIPDLIREATETVSLVLRDAATYNLNTTTPQTVTIADNNSGALPGVSFDLATARGPESLEYVPVVVSLSAPSTATVTVNYGATGGTATSNNWADFYLPSGQLTFLPGQTEQSFTLFVLEDSLIEPDETIVISLSNPVNALLDANSNYVYTIEDDDASGIVTINGISTNASEAGPVSGILRISRTGGTNSDLPVFFQVTGTASSPSDYLPLGSSVIIPAGQNHVDLSVTPVDDDVPEPTETVVVTLTSVAAARIGNPSSATVWIADNDSSSNSPIVSIVATNQTAGPSTDSFAISRDRNANTTLTIGFSLGGTAASGTDYATISNFVTIPPGASSAIVTVTPIGTPTSDKTVIATLTDIGTYRVDPTLSSATVTITANHAPIAGNDVLNVVMNHSRTVSFAELLANDNDEDGDTLVLNSVSPVSTHGGSVVTVGTNVIYTPSTNFVGMDVFTYQVSDNRGGYATGTVFVTVWSPTNPSINRFTAITVTSGVVLLRFSGIPSYAYSIERSSDLNSWTAIGNAVAATNGIVIIQDAPPHFTPFFYRASIQFQ